MLNPLIWIDSKILRFFTKLSHKFQSLTGSTNYFLAKIALAVIFVDQSFEAWNYFSKFDNVPTKPWQLIVNSLMVVSAITYSFLCDSCEKAMKEAGHEETLPAFLEFFFNPAIRMAYLGFAIWATCLGSPMKTQLKSEFIHQILGYCYSWGFVAFFYLMAVTPLPPSRSKIKQWLIEICNTKIVSARPIPAVIPK